MTRVGTSRNAWAANAISKCYYTGRVSNGRFSHFTICTEGLGLSPEFQCDQGAQELHA